MTWRGTRKVLWLDSCSHPCSHSYPARWNSSRTCRGTLGREGRRESAPLRPPRPSSLARPCRWRNRRTTDSIHPSGLSCTQKQTFLTKWGAISPHLIVVTHRLNIPRIIIITDWQRQVILILSVITQWFSDGIAITWSCPLRWLTS